MAATLLCDSDMNAALVAPAPAHKVRIGPSMKIVYMQCYFVTIATILGTGILGLPVTLSKSGIYPFLVSFILGFLVQILLIFFFTDILQRAYAVQLSSARENGPENVPLNDIDIDAEEDYEDLEDEHEMNGPVMAGHIIIPKDINVKPPNLHLLGQLFLGCGTRQLFDIVLFIQFIALLISYALAGSEAYAEVIGINHVFVIPAFVWILTFAIVFAVQIIQPLVSILTFAKGSLLLATVIVTFFVGASISHEVSNDFSYIGAPFLMGTVALGGIVNVMPFLYSKVQPVAIQIRGFRNSIIAGLMTCAILNVLWCWAVLDIVPQTSSCFTYQLHHNNSMHVMPSDPGSHHRAVCTQNLSLQSASQNGEISTLPLTKIIHNLYPGYDWVAFLVELFIMISITVSYLTIGTAMHHTLSGWIESAWSKDKVTSYTSKIKVTKRCQACTNECMCRSILSLTAFGIVFAVAMVNPQGFELILEKVGSLFLNLEAGVFIFLMIRSSRNSENRKLKIPLPLSAWAYHLQYIIPIYFTFAVGYDIFITCYEIITHSSSLPWEHTADIGEVVTIEEALNSSVYTDIIKGAVDLAHTTLASEGSFVSTVAPYQNTTL